VELDNIVDKKITAKEQARIGKTFTGYVMGIKSTTKLIVRPSLHAPEMDPYDTISVEQISKVFNDTGTVSIGDKINYKL